MNSNDIRGILAGTFSDPADRLYWESKLAETERREVVSAENASRLGRSNYVRLPNLEVADLS